MSCCFFLITIFLLNYCTCHRQTVSSKVFNRDANESYDGDRIKIDDCSGVIYNGLLVGNTTFLEISKSNISAVEDGALCTQTRLKDLKLPKNKAFPKLTAQMFANCSHLMNLIVHKVVIMTPGFFQSFPRLHISHFVDVTFQPDAIISSETLKGFKGVYIQFNNTLPRKFADDAFSKLYNVGIITIVGGADEPPVFSPNTFKNLDMLQGLYLRNIRWGDIKWHTLKNLYTLGLDGPIDQENAVAFFNNLPTYFPQLDDLELGVKYYEEEDRKVVEGIVENVAEVHMKWNNDCKNCKNDKRASTFSYFE